MIIYRIHNSKHLLLSQIFYTTMALELVGTALETVIVMWLFGSLWEKWALSLKLVTPFLHLLFSAAQLWGAWIFYKLAKDQRARHDQILKVSLGIEHRRLCPLSVCSTCTPFVQ
jgi:hypothetical protein